MAGSSLSTPVGRPCEWRSMIPAGGFSARGDFGKAQGLGIRDAVMASGVRKPDRIIEGNFVEIGSIDVAEFREFAFVPARTLDPDIRRRVRDFLAHEFDGLGNTLDVAEIEVGNDSGLVEVAMGVNHARSGSASVEVDGAGV